MSRANKLQGQHRVAKALRERLADIRKGDHSWHTCHQTGVLFSELANSAFYIQPKEPADAGRQLLAHAHNYFVLALEAAPGGPQSVPWHAIRCDMVLMYLRRSRHNGEGDLDDTERARNMLEVTTNQLISLHGWDKARHPQAYHQSFIAFLMASHLAWGGALGYALVMDVEEVEKIAKDIETYFPRGHQFPDNGRAYRSWLLTMALGYDTILKKRQRFGYGMRAYSSALKARDFPHVMRAVAIAFYGLKGEQFFRRWRDQQAVVATW